MSERSVGGQPASEILTRAVELTEDGQWHDYDTVAKELAKLIPPGKAMRRAEQTRLTQGGPAERRLPTDDHRVIETGKKAIVRGTLRGRWFEVDPPGRHWDGQTRRVRLIVTPPTVMQARQRAAMAKPIDPQTLIPRLLKSADVTEDLRNLTESQLRRLVEALVAQMKSSEARWLEW